MERATIDFLLAGRSFPENTINSELIETHISWVIICDEFVYKIKKPIKYSFLDFSTIEKRKFYCEKEIKLNKRLTNEVYIEVVTVKKKGSNYFIRDEAGEIVDYAVKMHKLPPEKRMDKLLRRNEVSINDINNLAIKISKFHKQSSIVRQSPQQSIRELFNDILTQKDFLEKNLLCGNLITDAVNLSDRFYKKCEPLLKQRIADGFIRDCHGDLHSRNIFLLPEPQPFDCIEFNDEFRKIDVLNEIAFLCMDLDAFARHDLSALFFDQYNAHFTTVKTEKDKRLFIYYKAYRANVRAKVNSLRARDASISSERKEALDEAYKYLVLMSRYISAIQ